MDFSICPDREKERLRKKKHFNCIESMGSINFALKIKIIYFFQNLIFFSTFPFILSMLIHYFQRGEKKSFHKI